MWDDWLNVDAQAAAILQYRLKRSAYRLASRAYFSERVHCIMLLIPMHPIVKDIAVEICETETEAAACLMSTEKFPVLVTDDLHVLKLSEIGKPIKKKYTRLEYDHWEEID